jgi:hypothetical protein
MVNVFTEEMTRLANRMKKAARREFAVQQFVDAMELDLEKGLSTSLKNATKKALWGMRAYLSACQSENNILLQEMITFVGAAAIQKYQDKQESEEVAEKVAEAIPTSPKRSTSKLSESEEKANKAEKILQAKQPESGKKKSSLSNDVTNGTAKGGVVKRKKRTL